MTFREMESGSRSGGEAKGKLLRTARIEEILKANPISPEIGSDSRNWEWIGGLGMKDVYLPRTGPLAQEKVVVCLSKKDKPISARKMVETSKFLWRTPNRQGYFLDIYAWGSIEPSGQKWQVVEYVDGQTLQDEEDRWMKGVDLPLQMEAILAGCRCMEEAVELGVMVQDLDPSAFMVNREGKIKLVDCMVVSLTETDPVLLSKPNIPGDIGEELVRLVLIMFPGFYAVKDKPTFDRMIREAFWKFPESRKEFLDLIDRPGLPSDLRTALLAFTEKVRSDTGASAVELVRDLSGEIKAVRDRVVEEKELRQAEENVRFRIGWLEPRDLHPMVAGVIVWNLLASLSQFPEERRRKIASDCYPNYNVPLAGLYSYILSAAVRHRANLRTNELYFPAGHHPGEAAFNKIKSIVGLCSKPEFRLEYDDEALKLVLSQLIEALHRMTSAERDRLAGAVGRGNASQLYADLVATILGTR